MGTVRMRGYDESVLPFCNRHRQLIADPVCFLSRNLSRLERLSDLVGDHIPLLLSSGKLPVLPF